jgi:hypothetical protein
MGILVIAIILVSQRTDAMAQAIKTVKSVLSTHTEICMATAFATNSGREMSVVYILDHVRQTVRLVVALETTVLPV